jgi:hypothetical protein
MPSVPLVKAEVRFDYRNKTVDDLVLEFEDGSKYGFLAVRTPPGDIHTIRFGSERWVGVEIQQHPSEDAITALTFVTATKFFP